MTNLIIKLNDPLSLQKSPEGTKINKLVSSFSPLNFIKLLYYADNKVNPRIAKVNRITKSIHETLDREPELFWLKSKGILLATESCKILERNRVEMTFDNMDYEGIMDGGHNCLAIATFIVGKLFDVSFKNWDECKTFWRDHYDELIERFQADKDQFNFSIPVEIIFPNDENGAPEEYYDYISEICSARNNNVQLNEASKGNQVGYYDHLKEILDEFDIIWKTGDSGKIKAEDVISLATLPLVFLKENELLPEEIKTLNKISLYSQKSRCVDYFNLVVSNNSISDEVNGKYTLKNEFVKSALTLTKDILCFFDQMYINFPELYHKASPGKFGRIKAVNQDKQGRVLFYTTEETANYQYPFGFFYPLVAGLTSLMQVDKDRKIVTWRENPCELDLFRLDLTQYVNIIKLVNFDPQKVGKGDVFYKEAEVVFNKI